MVEPSRLLPLVTDQDRGEWCQSLGLTTGHAESHPRSKDLFGRTGDPIADNQNGIS
jgi:hypothetical protein